MNNGIYMNPYGNYNPYMSYSNPQSQLQALEQQKRDIEQRMSGLQGQLSNQGQPTININNSIPQQQTQQNKFDFNGMFLDDEEKIKSLYDSTLPIIIMSTKENTFRIKNIDGTIKKYKFEEVVEKDVENNPNEEVELLKKQVEQQQIALNQIIGLLSAQKEQTQQINRAIENEPINANTSVIEQPIKKQTKPRKTIKNEIIESKGDK